MSVVILAISSTGRDVFLALMNISLQMALLILLVWSAIRVFRLRSAITRYYLWFLAVFGVLALPLLGAFLPGVNIPMMRNAETAIGPIYARSITVDEPIVVADMPASVEIDQQTTQKRSRWTSVSHLLRQFGLISIIVLAWFVVALFMLFRLMCSYAWVRRLRKRSQRVVDGPILEIISRLRERMSITRGIHVFMSEDIHSPTSFGLFSTTIVLPESLTDGGDEELEMVLSHEIAHAKRDDWVIEMTGRRDDYAECLVGLVENAYYLRSISMAIMEHRHNISMKVSLEVMNAQ